VVHLTHGPAGARRVSGVVALGAAVDHLVEVYGAAPDGGLRRVSRPLGDLPPRLRARLRPHLPGDEVPHA